MKNYLKELAIDELVAGLDYLSRAELKTETLKKVKVRFIHGTDDRIAPLKEILDLKEETGAMDLFTIKGAGHLPFLRNDFKEVFHGK